MITSLFSKEVLDFIPGLSSESESFNKIEIRKLLESVIENFKYEGNDKDIILAKIDDSLNSLNYIAEKIKTGTNSVSGAINTIEKIIDTIVTARKNIIQLADNIVAVVNAFRIIGAIVVPLVQLLLVLLC